MAISTIEQYESIRNSIKANINTIRTLVMQVDSLNGYVADMQDAEKKQRFEDNIKALYATINTLIRDTDELLDESVQYAKDNLSVS